MAPRIKKPAPRKKDTGLEQRSSNKDRTDKRRRDKLTVGKPIAGRQAAGKPVVRKSAAGKPAAPSRPVKGRKRLDKSRARPRVGKATQEKLKGWLATPADWARFNAWAEIKAQPKKIPEPEAIVRPSKPLSQLKKRMIILSVPRKAADPSINCRLDLSISKAALKATPSIRTNLLALPIIRLVDYGRVYYQVSPAALKYVPSQRICELSQPHFILPEECKPPRLRMCRPRILDRERLKMLAMKKKLLHCPEQLTKEEIEELFTPLGIRRTALAYQITPWVEFLALPGYKMIKERRDKQAVTWKKAIINDGEQRGKEALVEHAKRRAKERERERRMRKLKKKLCKEEKEKKRREKQKKEEERRRRYEDTRKMCEEEDMIIYEAEEDRESKKKEKYKKKLKKRETRDDGDAKKVSKREESEEKLSEEEKKKRKEEEKRREKIRKKKKHAWRFAPYPCKHDPYLIKKAALKFEASARMTELSKPQNRKNTAIRADPFKVKKAALSASASGRVEDLAKPTRPRSPVERKPPREKDAYGRPIFIIPVYGKVLPKTKPYKMGECPKEEEKKKKKVARKRPIDPIVYQPSYDPCIYPELAKRQKMERKRAAKLSQKKGKRRRRRTQMKQVSKITVAEDEDKEVELEGTNVNEEEEEEEEE